MPNLVILAGPNGAGKSTSAPFVIDELMALGAFVNADVIARGLSAFDVGGVGFQAGRIMLERLEELAAQRADFAFETTLASRTFAPFIRRLRAHGYHVQLVHVWVNSADLCIERVRNRVISGGHFVEDEIVRRRYDNSDDPGGRLVGEGYGLESVTIYEPQVWGEMQRRAGR